ncbi:MAG: PilT/PilU family type 4a pilus ATPase, partial [Alicyclobacillus shizuokensis]|nr:PilT/PilU family type 4a pilus ATPase [Alicyclobacillus shizuokensis]
SVDRRAWARGDELDFSFSLGDLVRIRGHLYRTYQGWSLALRLLPARVPSLADLHLPAWFEVLANQPGLVVVTGPTGSGKSSTLAALVHCVNQAHPWHIVTIEDPIEFVHDPVQARIDQREVGTHTRDFTSGLRTALRQDPDVILIGELRDVSTMEVALTAAETGHLVLTTMHTGDAVQTVERILGSLDQGRDMVRWQLASVLRAVVAQRLLRARAGGLIPALEVLVNTPAVTNLIRTGQTHQLRSVMQTGRVHGMQTFAAHIQQLLDGGLIESSPSL